MVVGAGGSGSGDLGVVSGDGVSGDGVGEGDVVSGLVVGSGVMVGEARVVGSEVVLGDSDSGDGDGVGVGGREMVWATAAASEAPSGRIGAPPLPFVPCGIGPGADGVGTTLVRYACAHRSTMLT